MEDKYQLDKGTVSTDVGQMSYSWIEYLAAIVSILSILGAFTALGRFFYKRFKRKRKYYRQINRKSSKIKPESLLGIRPIYDYFSRGFEETISDHIKQKKNLLLLGRPLSGKSRHLYETINNITNSSISILKIRDYRYEDFIYPITLRRKKYKRIVIIDDLHQFVKQEGFDFVLTKFREKGYIIISSCRTGFELTNTKDVFIQKLGAFEKFFDNNIIEINRMQSVEAQRVVESNNLDWEIVVNRFDGNIGSIFLPLSEMERRFNTCSVEEKLILRDIKKLHLLETFLEKDTYPISWIKVKSNENGMNLRNYEFEHFLENLQSKEFFKIYQKKLLIDDTYIKHIVEFSSEPSIHDVINEMTEAFDSVPKVLYKIGNKINLIWLSNQEETDLLLRAKSIYETALSKIDQDKNEVDYAKTLNNLAGVISTIGIIRNDTNLINQALEIHDSIFEIFTLRKYPRDYLHSVFNKANTFLKIYMVIKEKKYPKKALILFNSFLELIPKNEMKILYGQTLLQIGDTNLHLSNFENQPTNKVRKCLTAKRYFDDALDIFTENIFPYFYSFTLFSLGETHRILAHHDPDEDHCSTAINYYERAQDYFKEETFPALNAGIRQSLEELSEICTG